MRSSDARAEDELRSTQLSDGFNDFTGGVFQICITPSNQFAVDIVVLQGAPLNTVPEPDHPGRHPFNQRLRYHGALWPKVVGPITLVMRLTGQLKNELLHDDAIVGARTAHIPIGVKDQLQPQLQLLF